MKTTKCLFYCTKSKPYLCEYLCDCDFGTFTDWALDNNKERLIEDYSNNILNGTIVAECEVETEKLNALTLSEGRENEYILFENEDEILKESCLTQEELYKYLNYDYGYTLHIKNIKPLSLSLEKDCIFKYPHGNETITKAPQNMMWCYDRKGNRYALISIRPQWLCKILNGEKTIEIRKKVLKGMLEDEETN